MSTPLPDQIIGGKYRIIKLLGSGGMGAVYEVQQMDIGRRAAMKLLTLDVKGQPGHFQRFMNEARAVNQISHPGVVQVYDFGLNDVGQPWLVMEYLEGESLSALMPLAQGRRSGRALGMEGYWIIGELASALDAAHSKGIVHRDIKPANVMIVSDPHSLTGQRVKLLDFGIAKLLDSDNLTKSGSLLGTPLYMALEQFKNSADVDGKADVFALGVIAYQLLTGRLPHNGGTHYEIMGSRLLDPIKPLAQLAPQIPAGVAAFVMTMLEKEAADRPTMAAVDAEVRRTLGLPPPRASGFHGVVAGSSAPSPVVRTTDDEPSHSTADAPLGTLDLGPVHPLTPSGEKAAGEISPRDIAVPISLSSLPSVPVLIPPWRASPTDRTTEGAPQGPPPVALASPTSPTAPDQPRRFPRFVISIALGFCAVVLSAGATIWQRQHRVPVALSVAKADPPSTKAATSGPVPPASTGAPQGALAAESSPVPARADATMPAQPTMHQRDLPIAAPPPPTAKTSSHKRCQAVPATSACVPSHVVNDAQRTAIVSAMFDAGIKLCPSDRLIVTRTSSDFSVRSAPSGVSRETQAIFTNSLLGRLKGTAWRGDLEIRCPAP